VRGDPVEAKRKMDPHTRKIRNREKAAKSMLWVASMVTIGILISIVGFILFRGFVSNVRHEYKVIAQGEKTVPLGPEHDEPVSVIVHRQLRKKDITVEELRELFSGGTKNWGYITGQDLGVRPFALRRNTSQGSAFVYSVMRDAPFTDKIQFFDEDAALIQKVADTKGAIGFISGGGVTLAESDNSGVRVLPLRYISVVVNSEVLELRNNVKLQYLTESQLESVFTGGTTNWRRVGGIDLPVEVVTYSEGNPLRRSFTNLVLSGEDGMPSEAATVTGFESLVETLERTPGSVGYCFYDDAFRNKLPMLSLERRIVGINLTPRFLVEPPKRAGAVGGISTIIVNTVFMILLTLLFSTPIGVMAAIYLTEYAKQGRLIRILRFGTETLAGIPSIIFGLFGFIFFVTILKLGIGLLSGTLTITMMILPTIVRTSEEAIKAVPLSYREGSLALGATKWQTIVRAVLPPATPGIMTGVILGIGRAIGETAALLFTMGTDYRLVRDLGSSARTLTVHLYILVKEGISFERAFATATILVVVILIVNFSTNKLIGRMTRLGEAK
jgi:phosphate transport system permease protein